MRSRARSTRCAGYEYSSLPECKSIGFYVVVVLKSVRRQPSDLGLTDVVAVLLKAPLGGPRLPTDGILHMLPCSRLGSGFVAVHTESSILDDHRLLPVLLNGSDSGGLVDKSTVRRNVTIAATKWNVRL